MRSDWFKLPGHVTCNIQSVCFLLSRAFTCSILKFVYYIDISPGKVLSRVSIVVVNVVNVIWVVSVVSKYLQILNIYCDIGGK